MFYFIAFLILLSLLFMFGAAVGLLRLPDFYSRLHASGMIDTTGLLLFITSVSVYCLWKDFSINSVFLAIKLIFIAVFIFITSPTATHAIIDAGIRAGLKPWEKNKKEE
ncbi:MAG: monovalent cation/H(+) antiporter subunit G [Desulfobacteraceae bacterium]|nr:monovalent cation/H(+) antiporter subunit G [Desulfobacteraceae bacterium]